MSSQDYEIHIFGQFQLRDNLVFASVELLQSKRWNKGGEILQDMLIFRIGALLQRDAIQGNFEHFLIVSVFTAGQFSVLAAQLCSQCDAAVVSIGELTLIAEKCRN